MNWYFPQAYIPSDAACDGVDVGGLEGSRTLAGGLLRRQCPLVTDDQPGMKGTGSRAGAGFV
jgi:hypothetical protein